MRAEIPDGPARLEAIYSDASKGGGATEPIDIWARYRYCVDGLIELAHHRSGVVYFVAAVPDDLEGAHRADIIQDPRVDRVKIGFTRGVRQRMSGLRTGSAWPLELLAFLPGNLQLEAEWHVHFHEHRLRGEWFRLCPEIREIILDAQASINGAELMEVAADHLLRARVRTTRAHAPEREVREMERWLAANACGDMQS